MCLPQRMLGGDLRKVYSSYSVSVDNETAERLMGNSEYVGAATVCVAFV